jgi:hypothetical protein
MQEGIPVPEKPFVLEEWFAEETDRPDIFLR